MKYSSNSFLYNFSRVVLLSLAICVYTMVSVFAQQGFTVTGTVSDESGESLPGVSVVIRGTLTGTATDFDGRYTLTVQSSEDVLSFSFTGMRPLDVMVGNQRLINITLMQDAMALDELIVIGYGVARRQEFTGAVSSVRMENSPLAMLPNLNALESLKGNVAGMNIGATNSAGGNPSMLIRGQNSIDGTNNPLIILDGIIYLGDLRDINPNDIASFDILKDAVTAAVYGSRAANGIISITTKRGRTIKPQITLNASAGIQSWPNRPVMMKGEEWMEVVNLRAGNPSGTTSWMQEGERLNYEAGNERVWLDDVTRLGILQDYQLAVSGAGSGVNYYLSTSYNDHRGVVIGDDYNRISVFGRVNADITKWLNVGVDAAYSKRNYPGIGAVLDQAKMMSPYGVFYRDDQGNLEKYPYTQAAVHPLWGVDDETRDKLDVRHNFRLNTFAVVNVPWIEGLSYRINFMPNFDLVRQGNFYHASHEIAMGSGIERYSPARVQLLLTRANGNMLNSQQYSWVFDNIITYRNFFENHGIEATLVATRDHARYDVVRVEGRDFAENGNTTLGMHGLNKATVQRVDQFVNNNTNGGWERANIGYLARINYSYDGKYFLTGSVRRDGASVFGADRKWGNFLALGLAWRISEETFMGGIDPLDNLRIKFAWGQNGNQGINPYSTLSRVINGASGGYRYQFSNTGSQIFYGLNQDRLGNDDLGWEKTNAFNVGFESAWLGNRLFVDLDAYYSQTTDQIFTRDIPVMTGFKTITTSMGQVDNTGVELTVRSVNVESVGQGLTWTSNLTFWLNRNKLVKLYGEYDEFGKELPDLSNPLEALIIGQPIRTFYGFKQTGIVQSDDHEYTAQTGIQPGMPKYADLDGVPGISADGDRTILGHRQENFRLNLGNTVRYKGFELYVLITGILGGNNMYMQTNQNAYVMRTNRFNDNMNMKPYWTEENSSNKYPSINFTDDGGRFLGLQSRGFVRLQDIVLSYTFDQQFTRAANINALKVFFSAKNVAWITNWDGGDPETTERYLSGTYPVVATYTLGFNLSF